MPLTGLRCCVLHDGAAGNRRQALALAEALRVAVHEVTVHPRGPARWFAPRLWPGAAAQLGDAFAAVLADPPPLAIGCGRQAALATRLLAGGNTKVVQILDPRLSSMYWDVVVAPEHDRLHGDNVITLTGSLNPVDDAWLAAARARFPALGALPSPRTAVLVGGPTRAVRVDRGGLEVMLARLEYALAKEGGSVMLCGSPRTPRLLAEVLRSRALEMPGAVWLDARDGENFYPGALAWADRIVVTPDSTNMISEACATTAPVFIAGPERATGRQERLLAELQARGRLRPQLREPVQYAVEPLRETARVADRVKTRLAG
ncbi:MAG: mitochondrial fission ELM1 family protein [Arenimonas sp.]